MTPAELIEHCVTSSDLVDEMLACAPRVGTNDRRWPGVASYRLTRPGQPVRLTNRTPAVCVTAHGTDSATHGRTDRYGRLTYTITGGHRHTAVFAPARTAPSVCLVIDIEPATVRAIAGMIPGRRAAIALATTHITDPEVSAVDEELMSVLLRFLRARTTDADRRVLAPLYVQELVYRLLQRDQAATILDFVGYNAAAHPVLAALTHIDTHLADPLTVRALATHVGLSESALTRSFRRVTGSSPYQYIKEARLNRGRELLLAGTLTVSAVAENIGYASTSHFVKEFRARFGTTPGAYANNPESGST